MKYKKITLNLNRPEQAMLNELVEERKRQVTDPEHVTEESVLKNLIFNTYFSTVGNDDDPFEWMDNFYERINNGG